MSDDDKKLDVETVIDARDGTALLKLVKDGLSVDWADADGHSLLHHAALWGDTNLVERLLAQGATAYRLDADNLTPAETARGMGFESLSAVLNEAAKPYVKPTKLSLPAHLTTLSDIRAEAVTGTNYFTAFAAAGCFADLTALASFKDGLKAEDLLHIMPGSSDHLLYHLCETGQLSSVTVPSMWRSNPQELEQVWAEVPEGYRNSIDIDALLTGIRQLKLQTRNRPRFEGFDS